jgi:proteasome beta subunit
VIVGGYVVDEKVERYAKLLQVGQIITSEMNLEALFPLIIQALVGGVDDSGVHIFAIDPLGSVMEETCVSTGSGSPIAYGVLEDKYKQDASIKEMLPIVMRAIDSAMRRDAASGDNFDVSIIEKKGYRELSEKEKRNITANS